ncbi:hypothetical protein [Hyphomonas sp. CY54-11-8]|uniref:hypothetical protein n=1 Tax=Hyphomonas sp. CY54-11-8 TaxID=1280944 RepID=UPI00045912C6|nr:hypothetical protein [Hyphomonas sp. CY54-11-8]KCZ47741.1 hypothetical protein HY17_04495 [Hyphomonas sp. CY54-11-8]
MIGAKGITVLAFGSSSGFWEPYMAYPSNGPYPSSKGPPKDFAFVAIVNGDRFGIKPAGKRDFYWEPSDD